MTPLQINWDTILAEQKWRFELKLSSSPLCFYLVCSSPYQQKPGVSLNLLLFSFSPLFVSCISFVMLDNTRSLHFFPVCGRPLEAGLHGNNFPPASRMTASSEDSRYLASSGRLKDSGWAPNGADKDRYPYLQIDLVDLYLICGIKVQGCSDFKGKPAWVTRYRVQVSPEKDFWDSWNYLKVWFILN